MKTKTSLPIFKADSLAVAFGPIHKRDFAVAPSLNGREVNILTQGAALQVDLRPKNPARKYQGMGLKLRIGQAKGVEALQIDIRYSLDIFDQALAVIFLRAGESSLQRTYTSSVQGEVFTSLLVYPPGKGAPKTLPIEVGLHLQTLSATAEVIFTLPSIEVVALNA